MSFHRKHDFLIDRVPAEVKSLYSHYTVELKPGRMPEMIIGGQAMGDINFPDEIGRFLTSRKVWSTIGEAIRQGGRVVFLDSTHTHAGMLINSFASLEHTELDFDDAIDKSMELISQTDHSNLPVIVCSTANGYEHMLSALVVPVPVEEVMTRQE